MITLETAKDQYIVVDSIVFAYRLFGLCHGVPLFCAPGFRQHMDHWDPAMINPIAARRPVLLIDNAGIGRSEGLVPDTLAGMASHYAGVIRALGFRSVDMLGFSMGGSVVQLVALNTPDLVRRLIVCGTGPSSGEGVETIDPISFKDLASATTEEMQREAFLAHFFVDRSQRGQAAGLAAWERIANARGPAGRLPHVSHEGGLQQTRAIVSFLDPRNARAATYDRLHELRLPVLITAGSDDKVLPTANSILMWQMMKSADAQLHLYPDSGHGFLHQYAGEFAALANSFLDSSSSSSSTPNSNNATGRTAESRL